MRKVLVVAVGVLALSAIGTVVFAQRQQTNTASVRQRYLPEYTKEGDLILPKNFNEWVYVGSPLTPNALNGGKANFPEYHNVYIEPGSYEIYKKTGVFPEGTIFFKELQLRARLLPRKVERRRRYGQGYQALCRLRRLGLLQLQSPRAEGGDGQGEAQIRVRLLPYRQRQER
jgi:hypothetical protein